MFLDFFNVFSSWMWIYLCFPAFIFTGLYLTFRSKAVQLREFPAVLKNFFCLLTKKEDASCAPGGVHPMRTFFACIGGCVGIGNVVGIALAVHLGGPGAVFWMWVTAIVGALVKYSEVFLGMRYRERTKDGFRGGPMYVIQRAFSSKWVVALFCVLMCIYGVEIFQFSVITTSLSANFHLPKMYVAIAFLSLVILSEAGGLHRIGAIFSRLIPLFIFMYIGMGMWVVFANVDKLPGMFADIFTYAFTPCAAVGGFLGSQVFSTIAQGIQRACYSCDVGVGYASIVHSQSSVARPEKQAALIIFEVFLDIFVICTMSATLVLVTGTWSQDLPDIYLIQNALGSYFPYMNLFVPLFLFLVGYMCITTYFFAGMKTAEHLFPKHGRKGYYVYSVIALLIASFIDPTDAAAVMLCVLGFLLMINIATTLKLRNELSFEFQEQEAQQLSKTLVAE